MWRRSATICWILTAAVLLLPLANGSSVHAAEPKQIDDAIRRACDYLYSMQKNGNWEKTAAPNPASDRTEPDGGQWGGTTALCTYALLSAGESRSEPRIKSAIDFLTSATLSGTYAIGMRSQIWPMIPAGTTAKVAMSKDADYLKKAIFTAGAGRGFYDYRNEGTTSNRIDHSVSQLGVLGAWAIAESSGSFDADYWKTIDQAWRVTQHENGAWSYNKTSTARYPETIAMTAAGVATLFITQDFLSRGATADLAGNVSDQNIEKGMAWINDHYKTLFDGNRSAQYYPYYGLYGIERVGVASGYRFIGNVDWYKDGADFLIQQQLRNGGWSGAINTALSLLFLARGRAPVVVNKLDYDLTNGPRVIKANWNQRPRDAANLARYVARQIERPLNWQIIDFKASPEEMLSAPILYIAGNQSVAFTTEQKIRLKQFVEQGGLIVAHADGGSAPFGASIRRLGKELFKSDFRALPANHPIYTNEQFQSSGWRRKPNVLGLSNGVRELILLLPDGDYARSWQSYDVAARPEAFELLANIFQYAVDKQNLKNKGETYLLKFDPTINPEKSIKVARLKYTGNWDPEPAGWIRLAAVMNNQKLAALSIETVELSKLATTSDIKIAHLTGTAAVKFSQPERDAIRDYISAGGFLIVDAAGGSIPFAQSIEQTFDTVFGDSGKQLKEPLPAEHSIYQINGSKIGITYRPFAQRILGSALKTGRIRGMATEGHLRVIYSPDDLSAGLVGQAVDGISGYTPATATDLMAGIILQAAK